MKEAVAFILDASPSMNLPYDDDRSSNNTTRLDCAKQALVSMISALMLQSVTNEVCVIVCKTSETEHHALLDDDDDDEEEIPFPNLTELTEGGNGVTRPSVDLLRKISAIETETAEQATRMRGDFLNAIVLATDALHKRTNKKKYQRKIVLLTDAGYDIAMEKDHMDQLLVAVDALRNMECRLEVIGLDFQSSAVFKEAEPAPGTSNKRIKQEEDVDPPNAAVKDEETEDEGSETDGSSDEEDEDAVPIFNYTEKADREALLRSLTEKTGGQVVACSNLQQIIEVNKGKKLTSSVKKKVEFRIAPGLSFEARYMLLTKKASFPSTKKEAVLIHEETKEPMKNSLGQEMTDKVTSVTQLVDAEKPEDIVSPLDQTTAIMYGSSEGVPFSQWDYEGLRSQDPGPHIEILGYMLRSQVPQIYMMGPPYVFSGHESQKACAAISGLAKALSRLDKVAICTWLKTKESSAAIFGALLPFNESEYPEPIRLVFFQLPFAGEVKGLSMAPLDEFLEDANSEEQKNAADDLVDSLMLPENVLLSGKIPSPGLRSWNQTMVKRALDPSAAPVVVRSSTGNDPMAIPPEVLSNAQPALDRFTAAFPLKVIEKLKKANGKGRQGKQAVTYKDFLKE
jgi:ATP-dependent DNA helicase 2 subunit 2